jgi:hypothetical protein
MRRVFLAGAAIVLCSAAQAALVKYDFEGTVSDASPVVAPGTSWRGTLSFDSDQATPDNDMREGTGLPFFHVPGLMTVEVGPYTLTGGPGTCLFTKGGFEFMDMPMGGGGLSTDSSFRLAGDLFQDDPDGSLAGARWERMAAPAEPWVLNTYGDDEEGNSRTGEVWLKIARLTYSGGSERLGPPTGDATPTPEPSGLVLIAAAGIAYGLFRKGRLKILDR